MRTTRLALPLFAFAASLVAACSGSKGGGPIIDTVDVNDASTTATSSSGSTSASSSGTTSGTTDGGTTSSSATGDATAGDASTSGGCTGVPITPDDTGFVATTTNSLGIHGSWFVYSDCADLQGQNCAMVAAPTGTGFSNTGGVMCTSGTTSMATGAWGAGIALELNDGPPQMPYDTTAVGITGFCFNLSGTTIPSTTIRVAFPTQDNNDNAYFQAVSTPGVHTVLFANTAQGSWVTTKSPFEPTKVTLIQFQIPSSTTKPVPWDFCIDGLTAVVP